MIEKDILLALNRKNAIQTHSGENNFPILDEKTDFVPNAHAISIVEKTLISKLKLGYYTAFSEIFNAYYPDLVIFATKFTHDLSDSEEIVQDTFVTLWEERGSVEIKKSLKSYLLKTVQNKCIDWYRHEKIKQGHRDFVRIEQSQYICDTDRYLLYSELNEQIETALNSLPEKISETFRMNRHQGLKYHEIASILGVSVRTIEVRVGKALHLLRTYLKDYFIVIFTIFLSPF
jgi:RNA polymerase sigma-70 factor (ECF subfamily)